MTAPHEPDDKTRATVEAMVSYGIPQEDIAKVIGIDPKTLRKYYEHEIDTATAKANSQVAQRLYKKCMADDTTSIIFWLKTRAKWAEISKHEVKAEVDVKDVTDIKSKVLKAIPEDQLNAIIANAGDNNGGSTGGTGTP
jgi:hypothetical protein